MSYMKYVDHNHTWYDTLLDIQQSSYYEDEAKKYKLRFRLLLAVVAGFVVFFVLGCSTGRGTWPPTKYDQYEAGTINQR